jgi:formylglycine-generating enzyme required for sulfatase activity
MDEITKGMIEHGGVSQKDAELVTESTVLSTIPNLDFDRLTNWIDYVFFNNHCGPYPKNLKTTCTLGEFRECIFGKSILGSVLKPRAETECEDYKKAKRLYADAQAFFYGRLRDSDEYYAKAAELFQKAAEQGSVPAQFFLGSMYFDGKGVKKDYIEAKRLISTAIEQGYSVDQGLSDVQIFGGNIRMVKEVDLFVTKNITRKGGIMNCKHAEMQNINGIISYFDNDFAKAVEYFRDAAMYANTYAKKSLDQMYSDGLAAQEGQIEVPTPDPPTVTVADILKIVEAERRKKDELSALQFSHPVATGMVLVNGGTFTMGNAPSLIDRHEYDAQHQVTVSSFYMGKYEVTQKEWCELMGTNPSEFKGNSLPVENVSWFDAVNYCNCLSAKEELTPAYTINGKEVTWNKSANGYRLPTEAEWEYACRAGTTTRFSTGNDITTDQANYNPNDSKGTYRGKTTPVDSFAPNPWGLYDMHGNVTEWCWDWSGPYPSGAQTDPSGASSGEKRVDRGGAFGSYRIRLQSASGGGCDPEAKYDFLGFRLVRSC